MAQTQAIGKMATTVKTDEYGTTRVTYHATDVVAFTGDSVTLNSGGWRTATTRTRMNQASNQFRLGFRVYQVKGDWFVDCASGHGWDYKAVPFEDGMIFHTPTAPTVYRIIRFRRNGSNRTIKRGLTLLQAQAHCSDPKTRGGNWFDGYDYN